MRAVVFEKYGGPDVLEIRDIAKPSPKDDEILIKVHATTVTAGDWRMRSANPFLVRLFAGLFKPSRVKILGFELAGTVEAVGNHVKAYKKGDAVFADCGFKFGAYAEYKCIRDGDSIAMKPNNMSFEEAAAVPVGGLTAVRLLKQASIKAGDSLLVYGASGSVGTFAVQLGKYFGATVTAVCSTSNLDLVKSIGADRVIDYKKDDFTRIGQQQFDIIFDAVGKTSKSLCSDLMKPECRYVSVSQSPKRFPKDLEFLKEVIEEGKLKSVIDKRYRLDQIREAHAYVQQFRKRGNVVVNVI